jgi:GNAT superfamily N-acetyltransferase
MHFDLRTGLKSDKKAIAELIAESARGLCPLHYSPKQIEAALQSSFGVDSQLIRDRTYFLAMHGRVIAGCGGWSYRETLFGSDLEKNRSAVAVDPRIGAAKIRAFFIRPGYTHLGVGSLILHKCESEAWRQGFRKLELMATLSGIEFYRKHGYTPGTPINHRLNGQLSIEFVPMTKRMPRPAKPHIS